MTCPTPAKKRYSSERDARVSSVRAAMRELRLQAEAPMLRIYRCPCGGWHLTSRAEWQIG